MSIRSMFSAAVLLALPLSAQSAAFQTYGTGCGTGSNACVSANWGQPFSGNSGVSDYFALPFTTGNTPLIVCGIELYCKTKSGAPVAMYTAIWDTDTASVHPGKEQAKSIMAVTGTAQAHAAKFAAPVILKANTKYFIVFDNAVGLNLPIASAGTNNTHHFRSSGNWRGPFNSVKWMYRVLCCGAALPTLSNTGLPKLGQSFSIDLAFGPPNAAGFLSAGASAVKIDLGIAGAPNCLLLTPPTLLVPVQTNATGATALKVSVPNNSSLAGAKLFCQYAIKETTANSLGLVFSNGGEATAGN